MADIKFSEFPKATTSKDSDEIAILQDGVNKMIASPVLESKIINKTVSRVIDQGGASLNIINLKGVVPTYADLATITPTPKLNDAYQVEADGLVYVYTENGFQADGEGIMVQPAPIGLVEEGNDQAVSGGEVYGYTLLKEDFDLILDFESFDFSNNIKNNTALSSSGTIMQLSDFTSVINLRVPFCKYFKFNNNTFQLDAKFICQYDYEGNMIKANEVRDGLQIIPRLNNTTHISFTTKSTGDASEPSVTLDVDSNGVFINGYKNQNITSYDKFLINQQPYLYSNTRYTRSGQVVGVTGFYATIDIPKFGVEKVIISGIRASQDSKFFVQKNNKGEIISSLEITQVPFNVDLVSNCEFYGFTIKDADEPDNYSIDNLNISVINNNSTFNKFNQKYKGKRLVSFGDSIDWYDVKPFGNETKDAGVIAIGLQSYMRYFLGCEVDNQGNNGWDMTQILTTIKGYNYLDIDKVTLKTGANDHRKGVPIGTLMPIGSVFNNTTYIGAMQEGIEYILNYKRSTEIRLISPLRGWFTENGTPYVPNLYKGEFEISVDYVNAMKEVAELYSIPFIDIYHNSMINALNYRRYMVDPDVTPYFLHPNNLGYERLSQIILEKI